MPVTPFSSFQVAVYSRAFETAKMADPQWLATNWATISRQVHVDKVYLETHRDLVIVEGQTLESAKAFFAERGIATAGGITLTISEPNFFQTFDYANPYDRRQVREIVEHTARHFDEIILDDFFFTSSKSLFAIRAKGNRSWTEFRLELMSAAAAELVIGPAKRVNPNCRVIIKYPNWYEHFQGLGFNLEKEPSMFDGLYTGTETRQPSNAQHLQPYHGYSVFRFFENLKPGCNGGGWVDTGGATTAVRYAEQLWITLFAKAPEITLFDVFQLLKPVPEDTRTEWAGAPGANFVYDEMLQMATKGQNDSVPQATWAGAAGYSLSLIDGVIGELGNPVGVKSYKPYHSVGEDHLHSFLGMIGIPMDIVPEFPVDEPVCLVSEQAARDADVVEKIKKQLLSGKDVVITSGFLRARQADVADIVELRYTDHKALVRKFVVGRAVEGLDIDEPMPIPQIKYLTNDSWEVVSALDRDNGWPLLHRAQYATGNLYVLTIPENMEDLYRLPAAVTSRIKQVLTRGMSATLEGPGKTSIFVYDNGTAVVESFNDAPVEVTIRTPASVTTVTDMVSGDAYESTDAPVMEGSRLDPPTIYHAFKMEIPPHSFRAIRFL